MVSESPSNQSMTIEREFEFAAIHEPALVVDILTERIVLWNAAATALLGYPPAEAIGLSLELLVPEEYRADHIAGFRHFRDAGHGAIVDAGLPLEVPALHQTGTELPIEVLMIPRQHTATGAKYLVAILKDLSA